MDKLESYSINIIGNEYSKFYNFLVEYNVISIGMAFIISNQVTTVFNNLMTSIISPIFARIFSSQETKIENVKLHIFGIEFLIGNFLFGLLHFYIVLIILYYIIKLMPMPTKT
jgi:large-conductance mechanosensitive channel